MGRRQRAITCVVAAVLGALLLPSSPAQGEQLGTFAGTVRAADAAEWDRLVTVRLDQLGEASGTFTGVTYETQIDQTTGAFSLDVLPGRYRSLLIYTGEGNYVSSYVGGGGTPGAYSPKTVVAGSNIYQNDAIFPGGSVSGRLTGGGVPLSVPSISALPIGAWVLNTPRVRIDAASGNYVVDRLETRSYAFTFSGGPDWFGQTLPPMAVLRGSPVTDYDIDLMGQGTISGTATLPLPLTRTMVSVYRDGNLAGSLTVESGRRFTFTDLPVGTYTVKFGYGPRSSVRDEWWPGVRSQAEASPIVLSPGNAITGIDAVMEAAPDIAGTVDWTGLDGNSVSPADQIVVTLLQEDPSTPGSYSSYESDTTDYAGRFAFENVEPGRYLVKAQADPGRWLRTTYWPGTQYRADAQVIFIADTQTEDRSADLTMQGRSVDVVDRLAGADRYSTAIATTRFGFDTADSPIPVLYIASGQNYPDALSAGPAAVHQGGALLLVSPDEVPPAVEDEIRRLRPQKVVIVGGEGAISATVAARLQSLTGKTPVRLKGADRYETSREVARYAFGGEMVSTLFIATGGNFPDALAAGPAAALSNSPVVLVDGQQAALGQATVDLVVGLGASHAYVLGGSGAISDAVAAELGTHMMVTRIEGTSRYETALHTVQTFFTDTYYSFVATGENFPDALAGGALAGSLSAPLYLTPRDCLAPEVFVDLFAVDTHELYLLGGSGALSEAIEAPVLCG